jgi:hypothetical protein
MVIALADQHIEGIAKMKFNKEKQSMNDVTKMVKAILISVAIVGVLVFGYNFAYDYGKADKQAAELCQVFGRIPMYGYSSPEDCRTKVMAKWVGAYLNGEA